MYKNGSGTPVSSGVRGVVAIFMNSSSGNANSV
jgi:hypothetical protein